MPEALESAQRLLRGGVVSCRRVVLGFQSDQRRGGSRATGHATTGVARPAVTAAETPAQVIAHVAVDASVGVPPTEALEELIGDARIVLIGESSHGTHEFYEARAAITKWLIEQKGFCAVTAEADWPDAYRVNRYARGSGWVNRDS